jgi:hypothetical protein
MDVSTPSAFDASENGRKVKTLAPFADSNFYRFAHSKESIQSLLHLPLNPDAEFQLKYSIREESFTSQS